MIIEFTGPACSGKTVIIKTVEEILIEKGFKTKKNKSSFLKSLLLSIKDTSLLYRLFINSVEIYKKLDISYLNKLNFYRNLIKKVGTRIDNSNSKDIVLIDEGIMHLGQNFVDGDRSSYLDKTIFEEFYSEINHPDLLVVIDSPKKDLVQRLETRGHRRFHDKTKIPLFVDQGKEYLQMLVHFLKKEERPFVKVTNIELNQIKNISSSIVEEILKKYARSV